MLAALAALHPIALSLPATRGELSCQLVASADPALEDRWNHEDSANFHVASTGRVVRGQPFAFYVFMRGYGTSGQGAAELAYSVRITKPGGAVYHESDALVGWRGAVGSPENVLLAQEIVHCSFDPEDPLGTYSASVTVTDATTGASAGATAAIELVKYEEGPGFADLDALRIWMGGFTADPELNRIVPGLWVHCRNKGFLEDAAFQPGDGFFREVLDTNPWLFHELLDGLEKRSAAEKHGALWLLAHSSAERAPLVAKLAKKDKAALDELASGARDPLGEPLRELHDLNELYGRFLASHRLAPLERLILALHEDGGVISADSVRDKKSGVDVPLVRVVPMVAAKLLGRVFGDDAVARSYAQALVRMGKLPAGVADKLASCLPADAK